MMGACKTCIAFYPAADQPPGAGFCRRHPPVPIFSMGQVRPTPANPQGIVPQLTGQFPPVHERGGCCDHLEKKLLDS
jgi:hypothetical protein